MKSCRITVRGLVQGVGFRPFIYRLAGEYHLNGWIRNRTDSVLIHIEGNEDSITKFTNDILNKKPVLARIDSLSIEDAWMENYSGFIIETSQNNSDKMGDISPDIAVCNECLKDMSNLPGRINYPFVNCTNCGPRFSIIRDYPYDRKNTTMNDFPMCSSCSAEYHDIHDRRFHAEPVACEKCGPSLELYYGSNRISGTRSIIDKTAGIISSGEIVALKGVGGFQLVCDALLDDAVNKLRIRKHRDNKPFAVMMKNMDTVREYAYVSDIEKELLESHAKPVVILQGRKNLPYGISKGLSTIGCILPYMPLHYLLFDKLETNVIVFTSGNVSGEPIVIDNDDAIKVLYGLADALLMYNREIYNRSDDSVVHVVDEIPRLIRRSRGFVPGAISEISDCGAILACGPEQKVTFTLGLGNKAIVSQHIGDLENIETLEYYTETIERYKKIFRICPELAVCDQHPDYMSTRYAESLKLRLMRVQHHHAHICACMAEHGIEREVIGVSMDGTGYGDDGAIWGSEFMVCTPEKYTRLTHLEYFPLQGGDRAVREPWRTAVSTLYHCTGLHPLDLNIDSLKKLDTSSIQQCINAIDKNINTPMTSSMGRLFDAVAALLGLCSIITFDAEGPVRLQNIADTTVRSSYGYESGSVIKTGNLLEEIVRDIEHGVSKAHISGKFHNTIVNLIVDTTRRLCVETGIQTVAISGGLFQNRILLGNIISRLSKSSCDVLVPRMYPVNDGGISLGQLYSAAKRRRLGCV